MLLSIIITNTKIIKDILSIRSYLLMGNCHKYDYKVSDSVNNNIGTSNVFKNIYNILMDKNIEHPDNNTINNLGMLTLSDVCDMWKSNYLKKYLTAKWLFAKHMKDLYEIQTISLVYCSDGCFNKQDCENATNFFNLFKQEYFHGLLH